MEEERTILIHLNIQVPESDTRDADDFAGLVMHQLAGGGEPEGIPPYLSVTPIGGDLRGIEICCADAEEI